MVMTAVHLRTLAAVVRQASFAEAARELGYTQSAVSQQMAALERLVGLPLFERGARSIRPTNAALLLTERGEPLLQAWDALHRDMRAVASGAGGRCRLGSFPSAAGSVVPRALSAINASHPDAQISLDEGEPDELLPRVLGGELDIAVVYSYDTVPRHWPTSLTLTRLMHEDLQIHLPPDHALFEAEEVELQDLAEDTWISSMNGTAGAACLQNLCSAAGFTPQIEYRSNNYEVVRGLVQASLGVALIPALGAPTPAGRTALGRRLAGTRRRRHVSALHRPQNVEPLTASVLVALRTAARRPTRSRVPNPSGATASD